MQNSLKDQIVNLFEKHRKTPGAPFAEDHFLDYLLSNPSHKGVVTNSFIGLRRFNKFIDELQLKYGVCLSIKDRETIYTLDGFVERIEELQQKKRSSLTSLNNQINAGFEWQLVIITNMVLLVIVIAFHASIIVFTLFVLILMLVNIFFSWMYLSGKSYNLKLLKRIQES